eukprot:858245-Amphidinium_carterae.3
MNYFRDEHMRLVASICVPRALKATKPYVSCEDPKVKARWGASTMCKMQLQVLSNNTFTSSMEPSSAAQGYVNQTRALP